MFTWHKVVDNCPKDFNLSFFSFLKFMFKTIALRVKMYIFFIVEHNNTVVGRPARKRHNTPLTNKYLNGSRL
jgi:hypothetical protein